MRAALLCAAVLVAGFIWVSGQFLPPMVASHFGPGGTANVYMPRLVYILFMGGISLVLPVVLGLSAGLVLSVPGVRINLPHREYWLAPERRPAAVAYLRRHLQAMGLFLAVFLGCVHALLVYANFLHPPALNMTLFFACIAGFLISFVVWTGLLLRHFRLP